MLSSAGSTLTRLVIAKHTMICRAIELDVIFEADAVVLAAREAAGFTQMAAGEAVSVAARKRSLTAELIMLTELIGDVEAAIAIGWRQLARVLRNRPRDADRRPLDASGG